MSFGPAVVYLGPTGTTPTADVGAIGDDGVEVELSSTMFDVMQGNPSNVVQRFISEQNAFVRFNSIEWNVNQIGYTLGTGSTTISGSSEKIQFGGDPCPQNVALYVQHRKACVAHTVFVRLWTATPETGSFSVKFTKDAIQGHAHAFKAIRSTVNWAGASLATNAQLIEIEVQLT